MLVLDGPRPASHGIYNARKGYKLGYSSLSLSRKSLGNIPREHTDSSLIIYQAACRENVWMGKEYIPGVFPVYEFAGSLFPEAMKINEMSRDEIG